MKQYTNNKTSKAIRNQDFPHNIRVPKKLEESARYNPLENITCKVGDGACATRHVSAIRGTGLFHSQNENHKIQSLYKLQQEYGNRFVQKIIANRNIQPKLEISQPGDIYEKEADRIADSVMKMPEQSFSQPVTAEYYELSLPAMEMPFGGEEEVSEEELGNQPLDIDMPLPNPEEMQEVEESPLVTEQDQGYRIQRTCSECEEEEIQTKEITGQKSVSSPGAGMPLDAHVRSFFEPRFGHSFDQVRIHTDTHAVESARTMNALAYTVGHDIVFGAGQYAPNTNAGRRLIAHELTHVLQQNASHTTMRSITPIAHQSASTGMFIQRWSIGDPVPGINTIICDGSGNVAVQIGHIGDAKQTACLRDCVERHEQSHRSDAIAENASICKGVVSGKTVRPNAGAQRNATEIRASNVEIDCLKAKLPTAGDCTGIINSRITQMEAYRDSFK